MKYLCFGYYDKGKFDGMADSERNALTFFQDAGNLTMRAMMEMVDTSIMPPPMIASVGAVAEIPKAVNAKSTRR